MSTHPPSAASWLRIWYFPTHIHHFLSLSHPRMSAPELYSLAFNSPYACILASIEASVGLYQNFFCYIRGFNAQELNPSSIRHHQSYVCVSYTGADLGRLSVIASAPRAVTSFIALITTVMTSLELLLMIKSLASVPTNGDVLVQQTEGSLLLLFEEPTETSA